MASPQTENGYIKISNELFEHLCQIRINGEAMQVFNSIIRKTYGYGKREDTISLSQFSALTGLKRPTVTRALHKLLRMNLIIRTKNDNTYGVNSYRVQKDYDRWKPEPKKIIEPKMITTRTKNDKATEPKMIHTIYNTTKDNIKDNNKRGEPKKITPPPEIPEAIKETFRHYLEMRQKIRKPATDKAKELILKELARLGPDESTQIKILEQSIQNSWQGVFPLKTTTSFQQEPAVALPTCDYCRHPAPTPIFWRSVLAVEHIEQIHKGHQKFANTQKLCAECMEKLNAILKPQAGPGKGKNEGLKPAGETIDKIMKKIGGMK